MQVLKKSPPMTLSYAGRVYSGSSIRKNLRISKGRVKYMARIASVVIPSDKQVWIALTYVYGIGRTTSKKILAEAKIEPTTRVKDLTEADEQKINDIISKKYRVEGDLRRIVSNNIKRIKDINSYKGMRHKAKLPVNGQRTRTNARTRKGKAIAVGGAQPKAASKT